METIYRHNPKHNTVKKIAVGAIVAGVGALSLVSGTVSARSKPSRPLPPTPLAEASPIIPNFQKDTSRLDPETRSCFQIALLDTVLGVKPRYSNPFTKRRMILRADWHGLGERCDELVDANLKVMPTIERKGIMRPNASAQYVEIGAKTEELPIDFDYTRTPNSCVATRPGSIRGTRSRHVGAIWELNVTALAADGQDFDGDGRTDVITGYNTDFIARTPLQNICRVK